MITGTDKAFAAGAVLKDMADLNFPQIYRDDFFSLAKGLGFERWVFHSIFASTDQKEGMPAFVEKCPAQFTHQ